MPSVAELVPHPNFQENCGNDETFDWSHRMDDGPLADRYYSKLSLSGLKRTGVKGGEVDFPVAAHQGQLGLCQGQFEFSPSNDIFFKPGNSYDIVGGVSSWVAFKEGCVVRLLQLTRDVPRSDWRIPCPENFLGFKADPISNLFVTLTEWNWTAVITLRTMMGGLPHPKAHQQTITYDLDPSFSSPEWWGELHINGSRLGVVFRPVDPEDNRFSVVVWDWITGEIVLRLENERRKAIQFLDEYRILVWEDDDNFLDVYDTSRAPETGWVFGHRALRLGLPSALYLDVKMHSGSHHALKPTDYGGVESIFAADPTSIMVINTITDREFAKEAAGTSIVVLIEDILRTFRMVPFGSVVRWEEWCGITAIFDFQCFLGQTEDERLCFVAGSRFVSPPLDCGMEGYRRLEVYDFNPHCIKFAQASGQQNLAIIGDGMLKCVKSQVIVPWREDGISITHRLVHLVKDRVIIDDANYPGGPGARLRALPVYDLDLTDKVSTS